MDDFSHPMITDMRLMSGFGPHLGAGDCCSRLEAERRAYPAGSFTTILQPPDHMSELIVLILSAIEELIDFALDITIVLMDPGGWLPVHQQANAGLEFTSKPTD
jgi:hypothetical protein